MKDRTPPSFKNGGWATVIQACSICEDDYRIPQKLAQRYTTCSGECSSERRRRRGTPHVSVICLTCGAQVVTKLFHVEAGRRKYCSNACRIKALNALPRASKGSSQKRYLQPTGYVRIIDWSAGRRRFIMEHRLVMEEIIGRPLTRAEAVHHINGIPADNRAENLRLYATHGEHMRVEHPELSRYAARVRWGHEARKVADADG